MSKKKNFLYDKVDICKAIESEYVNIDNISDCGSNLFHNLPALIENNLACKFIESEYIGNANATMYRIASKFIQKYNKSLSEFRRELRQYEFGNTNNITSKNNPELVKLTKYVLDNGKYFAQLDNSNYFILIMEPKNDSYEDMYMKTTIYIVGDKYRKWRKKYLKFANKYKSLTTVQRMENITFSNGCRPITTMFKPFDQLIFKDKNNIINYIDNWYKSIPVYYNKYKMIPKLSILLYGPPGTGKSSFYKALANYLNISNITVMTQEYFNNPGVRRDDRYTNYDIGYGKTIYAIDDIDCICDSRDSKNNTRNNSSTLSNLLSFLDNPPTFDIKAEDGMMYPVSIVIATTNYYDKLDPAVKRYGRFDKSIEMNNFDKEQAQEMCNIYELKLEDIVNGTNKKDFRISPAKLQAICLCNIDNSLKNNVSDSNILKNKNGRILIHRIRS